MSNGELVGILVFLAFGGIIAAFFSRLGQKIKLGMCLGHSVTIKDMADRAFVVSNASTTSNTNAVGRILERLKRSPLPSVVVDFSGNKEREAEVINAAVTRSQALFAINTLRAHAHYGHCSPEGDEFLIA